MTDRILDLEGLSPEELTQARAELDAALAAHNPEPQPTIDAGQRQAVREVAPGMHAIYAPGPAPVVGPRVPADLAERVYRAGPAELAVGSRLYNEVMDAALRSGDAA